MSYRKVVSILLSGAVILFTLPFHNDAVAQTTEKTPTQITITTDVFEVQPNTKIRFNIEVTPRLRTPRVGGTFPIPSGVVEVYDGSNKISGQINLLVPKDATPTSTAIFEVTLSSGAHAITAKYLGDSNHDISTSDPIAVNVTSPNLTNTNTVLTATSLVLKPDQSVTLNAKVNNPNAKLITGTVDFFDGANKLGSANTSPQGAASFKVNSLAVGSHVLIARYNGSNLNNASLSKPLSVVVNSPLVKPTISINSSSATSFVGESITISTQVSGDKGTPTGVVTFKEGSRVIGSVDLSKEGKGAVTTSSLALGAHDINVTYSGDGKYLGATSGNTRITVNNLQNTHINLSTNAQVLRALTRSNLIFIDAAILTEGAVKPSGNVTFYDSNTALGTVKVDDTGTARYSTTAFTPGVHVISAVYQGDSLNGSSRSSDLHIVVESGSEVQPQPTLTLTTSNSNVAVGGSVTLTANIAGESGKAAPTGSIFFQDAGVKVGEANIDGTGNATITITGLEAGTRNYVALYEGDSVYLPTSSGSAQVRVLASEFASGTNDLGVWPLILLGLVILFVFAGVYLYFSKPKTTEVFGTDKSDTVI